MPSLCSLYPYCNLSLYPYDHQIDVCDKILTDPTDPYNDVTYLATFDYDLLDGNDQTISFDSSSSAATQTGEVRVIEKIQITNESSSVPYWVNDTIEAYRVCPQYGSGQVLIDGTKQAQYDADDIGGVKVMIIGSNFRDDNNNFCKFRTCISANMGRHPRRCKNQILNQLGLDMPEAGVMSSSIHISKAKYISESRIECYVPEYHFEDDFDTSFDSSLTAYECGYVTWDGQITTDMTNGNRSYIRPCYDDTEGCMHLPYRYIDFSHHPCFLLDILASSSLSSL